MKQLLVFLVAVFVSFCSTSVVAQDVPATNCESLATETGENISLWDALAIHNGINPATWTVAQFRAEAVAYATFHGLHYDKSGVGNVAIVRHLNCSRSSELSVATDTVALATTTPYLVDSVGLSPFQKEYHINRGARFVTVSVETIETPSDVAGSKSPEVIEMGVINPSQLTEGTDTATLGAATTPSSIIYVNSVDTVTIVDTISSVEFCHCTEEVPMSELWAHYMGLRKLIRKEKNAGQRALLVGCRIKLGAIVRSAKRYEAPVNTKGTIGAVDTYRSVPAEWCDQRTVYHILPKATLVSHKSAGGSSGLFKAQAKKFWRGVAHFFKSFGACRRASH